MVSIKKIDEDKQIVFGEVYAPVELPDSDGDVMSAESIESMAHLFMKNYRQGSIDVNHDNDIVPATVVESFIVRKGDELYIEGAWVVGVHIEDDEIWEGVKSGELNGFSLEGLAKATVKEVEIDVPASVSGKTIKEDGHAHKFTIRFDDDGVFLGGRTAVTNGHSHEITNGTLTEETNGHAHKFSYVEVVE